MFARSSMIGSFLASPSRALAPLAPFMAPCGARSGPPRARFGTAVEKTDRLAADGGDGCTGGKRCDGSVTERGPRRPQLRGLHRRPGRVHVDHLTTSARPRLCPGRDLGRIGAGQYPLFHADEKNRVPLEPLGRVHGGQRDGLTATP